MANGQFFVPCYDPSIRSRHRLLRLQSTRGDLRALYGDRRYLWTDDWDHGEGIVPVCLLDFAGNPSVVDAVHSRAYPLSSMFAVCQGDPQCITPGTYAFLGAAAALR